MPCELTPWEDEPETEVSSSRAGPPPRKIAGIGALDPPGPPRKPLGFIPSIPASAFARFLAGLILIALLFALVSLWLVR